MKKELFIDQWSAQNSYEQVIEQLIKLIEKVQPIPENRLISLPYSYAERFAKQPNANTVQLGVDHMLSLQEGSFTASLAGELIKESGGKFVILGSSLQKLFFGETSDQTAKKAIYAILNGIAPYICISETPQEYREGTSSTVLKQQLEDLFKEISPHELLQTHLIYEGLWIARAPFRPEKAELITSYQKVRELMKEHFGEQVGSALPLIVAIPEDFEGVEELLAEAPIDGCYLFHL